MYILSGHLVVSAYDVKTDAKTEEKVMGPNDFVFVPSMEPHSIRNQSDTENATFLCCIGVTCTEDPI